MPDAVITNENLKKETNGLLRCTNSVDTALRHRIFFGAHELSPLYVELGDQMDQDNSQNGIEVMPAHVEPA